MKRHSIAVILALLLCFSINVGSQDNSSDMNAANLTLRVTNFTMVNIIPQEFKVGDAQFNIQVENTGDVELKNLIALVSGNGFSTYNVVPIDILNSNEKSYIIVNGNFKNGGEIPLTIKINDKTFSQIINVIDTNSKNESSVDNISELSLQLSKLENNYTILENEYHSKKDKYDLSEVKLDDLKNFLRLAKSSLATNDIKNLKLNLNLALNEYDYQRKKLDGAQLIKKSFWGFVKNNLLLISSIGGAIITIFTFIELIKRKRQDLSKKAAEVKVIIESKIIKDKKNPEEKKDQ